MNIIGKLADKNEDGTPGTFPLSDEQVAMLDQLYSFERPGEKAGEFADGSATSTTTTTSHA